MVLWTFQERKLAGIILTAWDLPVENAEFQDPVTERTLSPRALCLDGKPVWDYGTKDLAIVYKQQSHVAVSLSVWVREVYKT